MLFRNRREKERKDPSGPIAIEYMRGARAMWG
jgi:hypothetical protein